VEDRLALTGEAMTLDRLRSIVGGLGQFWAAAEAGLDSWAQRQEQRTRRSGAMYAGAAGL